jgi:DNA-binding ferritin-like protein
MKTIIKNNNKDNKKINKSNKIKLQSELVNYFLEILMIIKVYHWKTYSYSEHKATDELYEKLNEYIDQFVETMLGKKGNRLNMKGKTIKFTDPSTKKELIKIIYDYRILLELKINNYIDPMIDTDLLNIRDEILGSLNQFLYLLTLK